jgi:hypothetical protein
MTDTSTVARKRDDGRPPGSPLVDEEQADQLLAVNKAWMSASLTAATLLARLKMLALGNSLAKAEPKTPALRFGSVIDWTPIGQF